MQVVDLFPEVSAYFVSAVVRDGGIDLGVGSAQTLTICNVYGEPVDTHYLTGDLRITRAGDVRLAGTVDAFGRKGWALQVFTGPAELLEWVTRMGGYHIRGYAVSLDTVDKRGQVDADGRFI